MRGADDINCIRIHRKGQCVDIVAQQHGYIQAQVEFVFWYLAFYILSQVQRGVFELLC